MVGTIGPIVHGARLGRRGGSLYVLASLGGAAVTALGLTLAGMYVPTVAAAAIGGIIATGYVLFYVISGRVPTLWTSRQASAIWVSFAHPWRTMYIYGFIMGLGWATPIRAGSMLVLFAAAAALQDPIGALILVGLSGVSRALPVYWSTTRPQPAEVLEELAPWSWAVQLADALILAIAAIVLIQTSLAL